MTIQDQVTEPSPFHPGEQAVQAKAGVRERSEMLGRRMIRPFMPDQHRTFFAALPMIFAGHVDQGGRPWASVLSGAPGFVASPDPKTLRIAARPLAGDPLGDGPGIGAAMGFVGMELATRRRNRVNGVVTASDGDGFLVAVSQSFGNCPQYINARAATFSPRNGAPSPTVATWLSPADRALIAQSDAFWVASHAPGDPAATGGVDISHRGGRPGFVKIEANRLTIPDFAGNNAFNTLGNIHATGKAGLLFIDFGAGDILMLTGRAELLWNPADFACVDGAERAWALDVEEVRRLPAALPLCFDGEDASPYSARTGVWVEAISAKRA